MTMNTYLDHWQLNERPFENGCDKSFFFAGCQHREALERMLYLVRDGNMGFALLTGEIGCGKTTVANMLKERLRGTQCLTVLLENAYGDFEELLREVLDSMSRRPGVRTRSLRRQARGEGRYDLIRRFRQQLQDKVVRLRRQMVLILDEAQQLSEEALVELKNLTNLSVRGRNHLTIVLTGQPELSEIVLSLPQVDQRVGVRYHLLPLAEENVGEYVDARMQAAGYPQTESAFTDSAKALLCAETGGIPREINRVCKLALDRAFSLGQGRVDDGIVRDLVDDVLRQNARAV